MEVDQEKGKSRGKKGRSSKGKGNRQGTSKGKGKERRPGPCLLCQGPHWACDCPSHRGGKGKLVNLLGKGHKNPSPFRQAYLEGDKHDWITGSFLAEFCKLLTSTESSFSIPESQCPWEVLILLQRIQSRNVCADAGLRVHITSCITTPCFLRERTRGRVDECFACTVFALESHILHSCAERARNSAVGRRWARRFLGLVVDHVDCSVFLSHLKLEDTVERLSSRQLALRLCTAPETRERLKNVLSQKKVNSDRHVSLAHAHGYLKISRNPLLRVYRDVPVKDETTHDPEIDLSVEPRTSCDQATDEHDVISGTRKRRRLTQITCLTCLCTFCR